MSNNLLMAYLLSNICTNNYWNRTTIVEIIVGGWVVRSPGEDMKKVVHKLFVSTNNSLFKQIAICLNQTNSYLFEQRVVCLDKYIHCVSKRDTTQPPTIISTIVVRFQ